LLDLNMDPKAKWAIRNIHLFPVEVNTADYYTLLRVPGLGTISIKKIMEARRTCSLDFHNLKKLRVSLKRARYFITCNGKMLDKFTYNQNVLNQMLTEHKIDEKYEQLSLF